MNIRLARVTMTRDELEAYAKIIADNTEQAEWSLQLWQGFAKSLHRKENFCRTLDRIRTRRNNTILRKQKERRIDRIHQQGLDA